MSIFLWIVGIIVVIIIFSIYMGDKKEKAYQKVIADLKSQLLHNPVQFFQPDFHLSPHSYIDEFKLTEILFKKIIFLSVERNIRSPFNSNLIPSDITSLVDANNDYLDLFALAYSIANDRD